MSQNRTTEEQAPNNRPNAALVVIDVQHDVVAQAHDRDGVVQRINELVDRARAANVPVIWVQHEDDDLPSDTPGWQLASELTRHDDETLVRKSHRDAFEATSFEDELASADVGTLVVVGAQTDFCVRSTIHGAFARGYDTVLVSDAHTTDDLSAHGLPTPDQVIAHTNMYWRGQNAPGRHAGVVTAAEVTFSPV